MSEFEFVFTLFGLLLGLRIGWLTPLLALIVGLDLISFWTLAWRLQDAIPPIYFNMMCGMVVTGLYYLVARLVFPSDPAEWPDYDSYYFIHKKLVLGGIAMCNLLAFSGQLALGFAAFRDTLELVVTLSFYALLLAAYFARSERVNLVFLAVLVLQYPVWSAVAVAVRG
jgi:hypothetical protein